MNFKRNDNLKPQSNNLGALTFIDSILSFTFDPLKLNVNLFIYHAFRLGGQDLQLEKFFWVGGIIITDLKSGECANSKTSNKKFI